MKNRKFRTDTNVGIVFKCQIEEAIEIKKAFLERNDIQLVYFKTSNTKLWIQEGENPDV